MQIKTTTRYHLLPVRLAFIKNTRDNKCWWGCGPRNFQDWRPQVLGWAGWSLGQKGGKSAGETSWLPGSQPLAPRGTPPHPPESLQRWRRRAQWRAGLRHQTESSNCEIKILRPLPHPCHLQAQGTSLVSDYLQGNHHTHSHSHTELPSGFSYSFSVRKGSWRQPLMLETKTKTNHRKLGKRSGDRENIEWTALKEL